LNFENCYSITFDDKVFLEEDFYYHDNWEMDSIYFEQDMPVEFSSGWFPKILFKGADSYFIYNINFRTNLANNIISNSFVPTVNGFSAKRPSSKALETRRRFSNEKGKSKEQIIKANGGLEIEYRMLFKPMNAILSVRTGISEEINQLFSEDKSRSFIDFSGNEVFFKEFSIIQIDELNIKNSILASFPIYGGFIKEGDSNLSSYYFITIGLAATYPIYSLGTQYMQIGNNKDKIRYDNGLIRQTLFKDKQLKTLNNWKYYAIFGVGWEFNTNINDGMKFEILTAYRTNSAISDANWNAFDINIIYALSLSYFKEFFRSMF